jgi:hypothetical protein
MNKNTPVASEKVAEYNALRQQYRTLMHELNTSTSAVSNILIGMEDYEPNGVARVNSLVAAQNFINERLDIISKLNVITGRLDYLILMEGADKEAAEFNLARYRAVTAAL